MGWQQQAPPLCGILLSVHICRITFDISCVHTALLTTLPAFKTSALNTRFTRARLFTAYRLVAGITSPHLDTPAHTTALLRGCAVFGAWRTRTRLRCRPHDISLPALPFYCVARPSLSLRCLDYLDAAACCTALVLRCSCRYRVVTSAACWRR